MIKKQVQVRLVTQSPSHRGNLDTLFVANVGRKTILYGGLLFGLE
jgi:hypothetical protein